MSERSERPSGAGSSTDPLGNASQEAARLLDALGQWLGARTSGESSGWGEHIATGAAECRLCPLCRLIALARETSPELAGHLDDALHSVSSALRLISEHFGASPDGERRAGGYETIVIN
jgi:hypothetical protein